MSINIENLVQAIRFDVDYHCLETRRTAPIQGSINRELYTRLKRAENKGNIVIPTGIRTRVLNSLGERASQENHALFDEAMDIFKDRLAAFNENTNNDYSGTEVVIEG